MRKGIKRHLLIPLKLQAAIALPALSMVFPVVLTVARKEVISIGGSEYGDKKIVPCNESPQSRVGDWHGDYKAPQISRAHLKAHV